jgi:hypothetical protein
MIEDEGFILVDEGLLYLNLLFAVLEDLSPMVSLFRVHPQVMKDAWNVSRSFNKDFVSLSELVP